MNTTVYLDEMGTEEKGVGRAGWEGGGARRVEDDGYLDDEMGIEENGVGYRNGVTEGYRGWVG